MPSAELLEAKRIAENTTVFSVPALGSGGADIDSPAYEGAAFRAQIADVVLVRDVYGGTRQLREKKQTYLPQHAKEDDGDYLRRLSRARLFNALKHTVGAYTGLIHRKPIVLGDDVPAPIREHAENIDLAGRHLDVFARDVTDAAQLDGHTFIHVEFPTVDPQIVRTRTDERQAGLRPYWTHVLKSDAINWHTELVNGEPVLRLFAYRESTVEQSGRFGERLKQRIRVLYPGRFEVYERDDANNWVLSSSGPVSIGRIPIIAIYSNRTGYLMSEPPHLDLAYENLGHYVNSNEHEMSLARSRIPMPFFVGVAQEEVTWGPNFAIFTDKMGASASMLESAGNALERSEQDLRNREARMAVLGASMLVKEQSQAETAYAKRLDAAESDSALASFARNLQDGIEESLGYHAEFMNLGRDRGGSITVDKDFRDYELDAQKLGELRESVMSGLVSRETYFFNLARARYLPDDFDPEEEMARIDAELAGSRMEARPVT